MSFRAALASAIVGALQCSQLQYSSELWSASESSDSTYSLLLLLFESISCIRFGISSDLSSGLFSSKYCQSSRGSWLELVQSAVIRGLEGFLAGGESNYGLMGLESGPGDVKKLLEWWRGLENSITRGPSGSHSRRGSLGEYSISSSSSTVAFCPGTSTAWVTSTTTTLHLPRLRYAIRLISGVITCELDGISVDSCVWLVRGLPGRIRSESVLVEAKFLSPEVISAGGFTGWVFRFSLPIIWLANVLNFFFACWPRFDIQLDLGLWCWAMWDEDGSKGVDLYAPRDRKILSIYFRHNHTIFWVDSHQANSLFMGPQVFDFQNLMSLLWNMVIRARAANFFTH